jgi:hypothetical protein
MSVLNKLPDRPLKPDEVTHLATLDGINTVKPLVYTGLSTSKNMKTVCLLVELTDGSSLTLGWKKEGTRGWDIIN